MFRSSRSPLEGWLVGAATGGRVGAMTVIVDPGATAERRPSGSLVIDARLKAHHAPPLVEDPQVSKRVDALAAPGGPLHGLF